MKNRKEKRPIMHGLSSFDGSRINAVKEAKNLPSPTGGGSREGYLVCDLLFMLIICLALSWGEITSVQYIIA